MNQLEIAAKAADQEAGQACGVLDVLAERHGRAQHFAGGPRLDRQMRVDEYRMESVR